MRADISDAKLKAINWDIFGHCIWELNDSSIDWQGFMLRTLNPFTPEYFIPLGSGGVPRIS